MIADRESRLRERIAQKLEWCDGMSFAEISQEDIAKAVLAALDEEEAGLPVAAKA